MNETTKSFVIEGAILSVTVLLSVVGAATAGAEEPQIGPLFNIAATTGREGSLSAAFDGTNFLVAIQGDASSHSNIVAQRVGLDESLIGGLISTGRTGGFPTVAFGGGNFLMVWADDATYPNNDIYGQLISPSGALIGSAFPISEDAGEQSIEDVAFNGSHFLVVWTDDIDDGLYSRLVSPSGSLTGSRIAVGERSDPMSAGVASDGQDFLVVWQRNSPSGPEAHETVGRIMHDDGSLGTAFAISDTPSPRYDPISVAYNGSEYLVAWNHDASGGDPNSSTWDVLGRRISTDGTVLGDVLSLATGDGDQVVLPRGLASDGDGFLLTWSSFWDDHADANTFARYLTSDGASLGDAAMIAGGSGGQLGCGVSYGLGQYLCVLNDNFEVFGEVGGDVLGVFLDPAPVIMVQPQAQTVTAGASATFTVVANGNPVPDYRWQVSTDGGFVWTDMTDTSPYSGVTTATLAVSGATTSLSRYQFRCLVSSNGISVNSDAALLRVAPTAHNFSGSDDFTSSDHWSAPTMLMGEGSHLSFANDRLEHLVGSSSDESAALREWTSNVGSYTQDWAVQVDVHLASLGLSDEQYANLNLLVLNAAEATNSIGQMDRMSITFHCDSAIRVESQVVAYYAGMAHDSGHLGGQIIGTDDIALRITFNSTTKELSSWYDADGSTGGYNWALHHTVNIGSGEYTWDMTDGSTFVVALAGASKGATLTSGQAYFDNFQASTEGTTLHDWNGDGIRSIVGDVPPFVQCVYFDNCPAWSDERRLSVGDCNGDGILSIVGDVPCFVQCVYFGNCDE